MITQEQLAAIMPNASEERIELFWDPLNYATREFDIGTPFKQAAFLGTVAHESGQLRYVSENLNYSAEALRRVFRKYFTEREAKQYARQPPLIANRVYANRMGNGPEESGDGWRYRGLGLIQLTGKNNHRAVADYFGVNFERIGEWLQEPEGASRSAAWFWWKNGLNELADIEEYDAIHAFVNTGSVNTPVERINGYEDRVALVDRALQVLNA